jgi:hypothetical protein
MRNSDIVVLVTGICLVLSPIIWALFDLSPWWLAGAIAWWLVIIGALKLERKHVD